MQQAWKRVRANKGAAGNDRQANYLYQGDGKGKFEDVALLSGVAASEDGAEQANMGVALGDYLSQNDLRLHFGLGSHGRLDKAEIIWPGGKVETLTNLAADRFYIVREGLGVVSSKPSVAGKITRP